MHRWASCFVLGMLFVMNAQGATVAGLSGQYWDQGASGIGAARLVVNNAPSSPDGTFVATALDYPNGSDLVVLNLETTVQEFLGVNASDYAGSNPFVVDSVFRFSGVISLGAGSHDFAIGSDDGFELLVGGELVSSADGLQAFSISTGAFDAGVGGDFAFELLYYDGLATQSGLEVRVDGAIVDSTMTSVAPVPIGPSALLLASALGWIGTARVRGARARAGVDQT